MPKASVRITCLQKDPTHSNRFRHRLLLLMNDLIQLWLVLGLPAGSRRIQHHTRGLGLSHTLAGIGLYGLGR